jgi:hypothetical protein
MNVTTTGTLEDESGSGMAYQRRVSMLAATRDASNDDGDGVAPAGVADGVGVVVAGVQEPATSARVNTCARYLKVR